LRLRPALMRFAEPVRGGAEPAKALARLLEEGEVVLTDDPQDFPAETDEGDDSGGAERSDPNDPATERSDPNDPATERSDPNDPASDDDEDDDEETE